MKRWKIVLAFASVFLAGIIVGGLIVMRFIPGHLALIRPPRK